MAMAKLREHHCSDAIRASWRVAHASNKCIWWQTASRIGIPIAKKHRNSTALVGIYQPDISSRRCKAAWCLDPWSLISLPPNASPPNKNQPALNGPTSWSKEPSSSHNIGSDTSWRSIPENSKATGTKQSNSRALNPDFCWFISK